MAKNLFSIGEISKAVGVTRKAILNYEVKGLVTPDKKEGVTGWYYGRLSDIMEDGQK